MSEGSGMNDAVRPTTVPMKYVARVKVLPEYVRAYLDDGWTIDDAGAGESDG